MRRLSRRCLQLHCFWEGHDSAEAQVEPEIERLPRFLRTAGETMHDSAQSVWRPMLLDQFQCVGPSLARVNHDRFSRLGCDCHLLNEDRLLCVAWRKVVMIIEADFTHSDQLRMPQQFRQSCKISRRCLGCVMRMHSGCCIEGRISVREPDT